MRDDGRPWTWVVLAAGAGIGIASGLVAVPLAARDLPDARRLVLFLSNVTYWSIWAVLALAVLALGRQLPITGSRRWRALGLHAACSLAVAFVHMATFTLLTMMWRRVFLAQPIDLRAWLMDTSWITRWQIEWEITMYWAVLGLAHVLVFREEVRARALQAARLDAELSQAKLQALQQQIHPHFLFNTLQSISVLMHHNVESAEEMMERLGALLRGSLRTQTSAVVPLWRELAYVGHYLAVEGMNLGDRLRVQHEVALEVTGCHVPELLLQPLVENAVRHGITPSPTGGTVRIVARREGAWLFLEVSDDGVGPGQATEGAGIALENTRRRLALLYGDRHQFEILHGPERTGVTVRIRIPAAADAAVA